MLYDLVTEVVHVLNPSAGLVWLRVRRLDRRRHRVRPRSSRPPAPRDPRSSTTSWPGSSSSPPLGSWAVSPPPPEVPSFEHLPGRRARRTAGCTRCSTTASASTADDAGLLAADRRPARVPRRSDRPRSTSGCGIAADGTVRLDGWGPRAHLRLAGLVPRRPAQRSQPGRGGQLDLRGAARRGGPIAGGRGRAPPRRCPGPGKTTLTAALVRDGWAYAQRRGGRRASRVPASRWPTRSRSCSTSRARPSSSSPRPAP